MISHRAPPTGPARCLLAALHPALLPRCQRRRRHGVVSQAQGACLRLWGVTWRGSPTPPTADLFPLVPPRAGRELHGYGHSGEAQQGGWQGSLGQQYLQQGMDDFCLALEEVLAEPEVAQAGNDVPGGPAGVWKAIRRVGEVRARE